MEFKDYYKILEVPREASQDDIRKAYRKLARKYHPDVSKESDAEARMRDLNEANDVLRDPEKRAAYDGLAAGVSGPNGASPGPGWDRGFEFSGAQGEGPNRAEFQDFMAGLFKQAEHQRRTQGRDPGFDSGQGRAQQWRGEDHHADIEISLEDSFSGSTRDLGLRSVQLDAQGRPQLVNRTLSVKIPAGVKAGQMIRLAGQGMPGEGGGASGDLFLTVHFAPHALYQTDGRDLSMKLPVTPWEAALGGQVHVPILAAAVEVTIAAGSKQGSKLRLRGNGLPGDPPGDLYLVLDIVWPPASSEAARAAYEQLAKAAAFNPRAHLGVSA
jgi:curved DNA-binding protein